jgi:hypothetical protein
MYGLDCLSQKINSSVEIINQAALNLFCHSPGSLSGYVIFLDSLRCRDLTVAQLDTTDIEHLDKSWCTESSSNLPSRVLVGWSQPKHDLDRQIFGIRRRQASWFEDFLDPLVSDSASRGHGAKSRPHIDLGKHRWNMNIKFPNILP